MSAILNVKLAPAAIDCVTFIVSATLPSASITSARNSTDSTAARPFCTGTSSPIFAAVGESLCFGHQPGELDGVAPVRVQPDGEAGRRPYDVRPPLVGVHQATAQRGDAVVDLGGRGGRRLRTPQHRGQPIHRNRPPRVQQQRRQYLPLARPADPQLYVADAYLDRSQDRVAEHGVPLHPRPSLARFTATVPPTLAPTS